MSGHSKWSTIKHKKGALDKKRGKIFTKLIKEITVAAKIGGPEVETNPRLRLAVQNAKGQNMPKDNIERAIKKVAGGDAADYQEPTYEGYATNGVAVFVECTTDNLNRTVASVRSMFTKNGGSLGVQRNFRLPPKSRLSSLEGNRDRDFRLHCGPPLVLRRDSGRCRAM